MKKALAIMLMMLLTFNLSVMAFAKPGGFVSSPSGNRAPTVESFKPGNADCDGQLVVTPYAERDTLPEDLRTLLENAYKDIANSTDLTKLHADLAKLAADKNIGAGKLAASDLFNISVSGCTAHDGHYDFEIVLSAETLNKFVALLQLNSEGKWELVRGASVINNGKSLKFSVKSMSPLAIVVNTDTSVPNPPPTSDNWTIYVYSTVAVVSAVTLAVIWFFWRKSKN